MDGENNGKPVIKIWMIRGENPLFRKHPYIAILTINSQQIHVELSQTLLVSDVS